VTGEELPCRICGNATAFAGSKKGPYEPRDFVVRRCPQCGFAFIANPWTDYPRIYSEDYYTGRGADRLVDYVYELEHPEATLRACEWRGIVRAVSALRPVEPHFRWLDYGCGNGGLVRYVRERSLCGIVGFEEGWIVAKARAAGIPILDSGELAPLAGTFDIVTAVEVLEHIENPVAAMRRIRSLLKPGGLFFFTTGNVEPIRHVPSWGYCMPEVHISFFSPPSAARALTDAGFRVAWHGFLPGYDDIIRYKALKTLGFKTTAWWQSCLAWPLLARLVNARLRITAHPVGWAAE
jgi:SAM-dependent methyltransferase